MKWLAGFHGDKPRGSTCAFSLALAVLIVLGGRLATRGYAAPPDVDQRLLKDLDDGADAALDKIKPKPAGDAAPSARRPSITKPAAKSAAAKPVKETSPKDNPEARDEKLLKNLDGSDEPEVKPLGKKPGDDLGGDVDPLTRIGTKMRTAETQIDRDKLSDKTTQLQDEIVKDIDELIKQVRKKMKKQQQQASNSSSQSRSSASQRSKVNQPQKTSQSQPKSGNSGQEENNKSAAESSKDVRNARQVRPKLDAAALTELMKQVWGNLPEKDREQMRQGAGEQFLPQYETLIEKYFRRLAEEEPGQP